MHTIRGLKTVCICLCAALLLSPCATAADASGTNPAETAPAGETALFTDLNETDASYPYIRYLALKGIISGCEDGTFRSGDPMTRAEAAVLAARATGLSPVTGATPAFSDVRAGFWAYGYIQAAAQDGLISGYQDGTFRPGKTITKAEAFALLIKLSGGTLTDEVQVIADVPESYWAYKQVSTALQSGITTLSSDDAFKPEAAILRGEMAESLAKLFVLGPSLRSCTLTGTLTVKNGSVTINNAAAVSGITVGTGDVIVTGADGKAVIDYPDGSSILILSGTEMTVTESKGLNYIKKDGTPGVTVDKLMISLKIGNIFGALSSRHAEPSSPAVTAGEISWWDEPYATRTRVQIDTSGYVTEIKGTFWNNSVNTGGSGSMSLLTGSAEVTAGGQTVLLTSGQATSLGSLGSVGMPPPPPTWITPQQAQQWTQVQSWVTQTALQIQNSAPPPGPIAGQGASGEAQSIGNALQQLQVQGQIQVVVPPYNPATPLATPTPVLTGCIAMWSPVNNANQYTVKLYRDGSPVNPQGGSVVPQNSTFTCDFSDYMTAAGSYTVTVTAKAVQGSGYSDSAESDPSNEVVRPAAPSNGDTDDAANTFTCSLNPTYMNILDYQYSLDGGASWTSCITQNYDGTKCVITVDSQFLGTVLVRVQADTNRLEGVAIASGDFGQ